MAYDTGYSSFYRMKLESAWGTAAVPDVDIGLLEATGNITQTQGVEENYGTGSRLNNQLTYGKHDVSFSVTGKMLNGKLLAYMLGTDTPASTGPTTHTLAVSDTTALSSFTLGQYHISTDKGLVAAGCRINDGSITLDAGGVLTATYNGKAKQVATLASTVGTRPAVAQTLLPSYVGTVSWNSVAAECKSFTWNYTNNLGEDEYSVGDRRRKALTQGAVGISGSFVVVFAGTTEYADFQTAWSAGTEVGTKRALSLVATTGSTTTLYELSLAMTNVAMNEVTQAVPLDHGRIVSEYNYTATAMGAVTYKDQMTTTYIA